MSEAMSKWWAISQAGVVPPSERRYADSKCANGERWLLLAGAMDPPANTNPTEKKTRSGARSGSFLAGVSADINHMQRKLGGDLCDYLQDMTCTVAAAKAKIKSFLRSCDGKGKSPIIYYTGHGSAGNGDWCFSDGSLSYFDVKSLCAGHQAPWMVIDCCYSGHWANLSRAEGWGAVLAACPYFMTALDNDAEVGGNFTAWYCGLLKADETPIRPIICSDQSIKSAGYELPRRVYSEFKYTEWMKGELASNNRFVLAQYFHGSQCSMSFLDSTDLPGNKAAGWGTRADPVSDMIPWLRNHVLPSGKQVVHLSCGETICGYYAVENFGKNQDINYGDVDKLKPWIERKWGEGYSITSLCRGRTVPWVVVMTRPVSHFLYGDYPFWGVNQQLWRTRSAWCDIRSEIGKYWDEGYCISSLEYSNDQYFLVMTKSARGQSYWWGGSDGEFPDMRACWDKKYSATTIFKDPTDGRWLVVGTGVLSNRTAEGYRTGVEA